MKRFQRRSSEFKPDQQLLSADVDIVVIWRLNQLIDGRFQNIQNERDDSPRPLICVGIVEIAWKTFLKVIKWICF